MVGGGAGGGWDVVKQAKKFYVVGFVSAAGPARGMDAGSAVQRVDLEARIVGERPLPRMARDLHGLLAGIRGEAVTILDDVGKIGDLDHADRQVLVDLPDLPDLSLVLRRDDQFPRHWAMGNRPCPEGSPPDALPWEGMGGDDSG